jgi:two-component system NarL family response regulator
MADPPISDIDAQALQNKLTTRETDVLRLIAQGLTNREISELLGIATGTVNVHVHNIIRKLRVANRTQAAGLAISKGLASGRPFDEGSKDNS